MKAVCYARVSTKEQEETGYSLPSQIKLLEEYSGAKNLRLVKRFSISESASGKIQRKTFGEMLEYLIHHKIKIIICEKTDRLTRNLKDASGINDWMNEDPERQVHFVKEGVVLSKDSKSNEKFIWNIKVSVAQYYIDNLSEEVRKGQKEKISQGGYPSWPPVGYRSIGTKGHIEHVIDEEKGPLVKKAFDLYATGLHSVQSLLDILDKEGLRSRTGRHMTKSRFYELLRNPFFYGDFLWNKQLYKGVHEPLITKEVYDCVQSVLSGKSQPRKSIHFHLFRGLIKCNGCGGAITWETKKGHAYGHCHHYKPCNQRKYTREEAVEGSLTEYLDALVVDDPELAEWIREGLKLSHKDETEYHAETVNGLQAQHLRLIKRLDMLYEDKLDGVITKEQYDSKYKQNKQELDNIVTAIENHKNSNLNYHEKCVKIYELSQDAKNIYDGSDPEDKRALIKTVFKDLKLSDGNFSAEYTDAFELLANAVRQTNSSKEIKKLKIDFKTLEPSYLGFTKEKTGTLEPVCSIWRPGPGSNRRPPP
jgi:site-specific DNA recombinase